MKILKFIAGILIMPVCFGLNEASGQWATSGTDIYNTNTGNVGIGNASPTTLLYVAKNMTEPMTTIRNLGGVGGATYSMVDNASGANWKFKATQNGGFKIRDHANLLDVIVIEPNSNDNMLYISANDKLGIGTSAPTANLDVRGSNTDDGVVIQVGNSDISHRLVFFGGRLNDPNPFIQWKEGDPLRFSTDEGGWSEKMRITSNGLVGIGTESPLGKLHLVGSYLHLDNGPENSFGREAVITQSGELDSNGDFYILISPAYYSGWSNDNYMFKVEVFVSLDYNSEYPHTFRGSSYTRAFVAKERGDDLSYFNKEVEFNKDATISCTFSNSAPQDLRIDVDTNRLSGVLYRVVVKISI